MNIDIKATGLDLTEPLKEYIIKRITPLEKYLRHYPAEALRAEVEVSRTTQHHRHGTVYYAEVNLVLPGKVLRAAHRDVDIRVAVDRVRGILQREIEKYRDKQKN